MAIYAVGDVQGCHAELVQLLETISFDPAIDRSGWLALGEPRAGSLAVLRLVKSWAAADYRAWQPYLHLLAVGKIGGTACTDTLDEILNAPDRDELLLWLRNQKLPCHAQDGYVWSMPDCCRK